MSLHGGTIGVIIAIWWMTRREQLSFLRVCDYIACVVPFGLFFEAARQLRERRIVGQSDPDVPWAIDVFPDGGDLPRHPSQLYEALLEGPLLSSPILAFFFWKTKARYEPGKLFGIAALGYGAAALLRRILPRRRMRNSWRFAQRTGLHMGQWLTIPILLLGIYLIATAKGRRTRVEPIAGTDSVA